MAERYSKLFSLSSGLYTKGSPILISAGALLKDNETNWLICQLKLHSLSEKTIKFVKAEITCLDSVGRQLDEPIIAEYLDLSISRGEDFGTQIPVKISIQATRSYTVRVVEVGFSDNDIWSDNFNDWIAVPSQSPIEHILKNDNAIKGYKSTFGNCANMAYNECGDLWLCSCGNANYTSENQCFKCNALRDALKHLDENSLEKEGIYSTACNMANSNDIVTLQNAIKEFNKLTNYKDSSILAKKCDEKIIELKNAKKLQNAKRNKIIKISSIVAGALVFLTLLGYFAVYPLVSCISGNYRVYINMYNVKEFRVPNGTKKIAGSAFYTCESIETVKIPDSVSSIGWGAFEKCRSLTSIVIPDSVTSMDSSAFRNCTSLKSAHIGNGIKVINEDTFYRCVSLESIVIGNSVIKIGKYAFSQCESLTSIVIPASVTSIDYCAFSYCTSLTSIVIPASVTSIDNSAFTGCTSLTSIKFEGTRTQWNRIQKGYNWNHGVPATKVICSDGTVSLK